MAAGADPTVVKFQLVETDDMTRWVLSSKQSNAHTHDVRAVKILSKSQLLQNGVAAPMIAADGTVRSGHSSDVVISGGVDSVLSTGLVDKIDTRFRRCLPFPFHAPGKLAQLGAGTAAPLMLFQHDSHLDLWRLGAGATPDEIDLSASWDGTPLQLKFGAQRLLELRPKGGRSLTGSCISATGEWVAAADAAGLKLYKLQYSEDDRIAVKKVAPSLLPSSLDPTAATGALVFNPGGDGAEQLLVGSCSGQIKLLNLGTFSVTKALTARSGVAVVRLATSNDGAWLASMDAGHEIQVFNLDAMQHHATLPTFATPPTAFCFDSNCSCVIVMTAWPDQRLYIYDIEMKQLLTVGGHAVNDSVMGPSKNANKGTTPTPTPLGLPSAVVGLVADGANPNSVIAWGHGYVADIAIGPDTSSQELTDGSSDSSAHIHSRPKINSGCSPLMYAGLIAPSTVILVQRPWAGVLTALPDAIVQTKYGT
eukprot:SAG31_NODE_3221_length_4526_cov_2.643099_3_plen_479_part_00